MKSTIIWRQIFFLAGLPLILLTYSALSALAMGEPIQQESSGDDRVDPRFGIIEAFWEGDDAVELGVGWDRILFYWNEIQPTGPEDWNTLHVLEEWLDDARAQNRVVVGLLKNTPAWATDFEPFSGVPRGLYLPVDDPDNLWAGYVRKVVEYYGPLGIHHWIVWNEPEIKAGVYGHEFGGSTQDYYQLLKVAYQVAKAHDPQAVIHLAGWSYWHDPDWLDRFLRVATADPEGRANNYFFDVLTLHIYFRVETVEELVENTWAIQKRYGLQKPIWINETNASPNLDPLWPVERPNFQVDLDQQAWFIVQAHALGFGARSARIGVYKLLDVFLPPGGESFGILRPDGSRRPAFAAYQTTIRLLKGFTYPVGRQREQNFYVFTFKRPESVTRILWARDATSVTLRVPALTGKAMLVSALGVEQPILALKGFYQIRLRGARCTPACDIGGPPVFLVESGVGAVKVPEIPTIDAETVILSTTTPQPTVTTTEMASPVFPEATLIPSIKSEPTNTPEPTDSPTASPTPTSLPTGTVIPTVTFAVLPAAVAEWVETPQGLVQSEDSGAMARMPDKPPSVPRGNISITSWLFIGAALVLSATLGFIITRQRHS